VEGGERRPCVGGEWQWEWRARGAERRWGAVLFVNLHAAAWTKELNTLEDEEPMAEAGYAEPVSGEVGARDESEMRSALQGEGLCGES
jgi:hypothetical protein